MTDSTPRTVLILGGTGKVGRRIAALLHAAGVPALVASRSGKSPISGVPGVAFDWTDRAGYGAVFDNHRIGAVYIVHASTLDAHEMAIALTDIARSKGVRRFVLQSSSAIEEGGPAMGQTHAHLKALGDRGEIEWAVLRPTWFMQNISSQVEHHLAVKNESKLYSATGPGKIPWVSADDIAAVGVKALTNTEPHNTDLFVLGPELLSYGDVAAILSDVLGRKIEYVDLTEAQLVERHMQHGLPRNYAEMLSALDTAIRNGSEDRLDDTVLRVTGQAPGKFADFAKAEKEAWM